jgi:hypothetical protein
MVARTKIAGGEAQALGRATSLFVIVECVQGSSALGLFDQLNPSFEIGEALL